MGWIERHGRMAAAQAGALLIALSVSSAAPAETPEGDAAPATSGQLPTAPANGEMGFVFSVFVPAIYPGQENCPDGWANTLKENYLATLPPKEQARLLMPENEPELSQRWKTSGFGPEGTNVCSNYDRFPERPIQKTVQGKVAYGLNLDGDAGNGSANPDSCQHENFVGADGEKGVDNQMYRAMGCMRQWRGNDGKSGEFNVAMKGIQANGEWTIVLVLRGVDSLVNDNDVEVILASTMEKPIVDARQNFIKDASFRVTSNPRWRNVLHGRIVNGVLTTDTADILLTRPLGIGGRKNNQEWDFAKAKLSLEIQPDGTLKGLFGGYVPPLTFMPEQVGGGPGTVVVAGIDCASEYNTIMKLADGARDPKTGRCTRISMAMEVTALPSFVFDTPPKSDKSAEAK
jgi:hypothetical protein